MQIVNSQNNPDIQVVIMSLLFAFFSDIKCMTSIFTTFGVASEDSSIMSILYLSIIILIVFEAIRSKSLRIANFGIPTVLLLCYCLALYTITILFIGPGSVEPVFFLVFTIVALSIPSIIRVDSRIVIKAIMCYPAIGIIRANELFAPEYNGVAITIGQSYAFIVPVIATVIYLFIYFKHEGTFVNKVAMLAICGINCYYLLQLIKFGSRGPIFCLFGLLAFLLIFKPTKYGGVSIKIKTIIGCTIILLLGSILYEQLFKFVLSLSGDIYAIQKFVDLSQSGDVSNGRVIVYQLSWNGFLDSPFFGNGFAQFNNNTLEPYPHNSILQILYDGGLVFALMVFIPLIKKIKIMARDISLNKYALMSVYFFAGFVGSLFSDDLWMQPMLWLFFGLMLTKNHFLYNE